MTRVVSVRPVAAALPAVAAIAGGTAVAAGALALRLTDLSRVRPDPFYDAAVRSMGTSWHDFLFGALEPGGSVAIDKPAPALWPQVVATKLLGFSTASLLVPEALAGAASVGLVYVLGRMLWRPAAGLAAAAALAVLPVAVLTARSDTMDALATALTLLAAVLLVRSGSRGGKWALAGAGAAIGLAFNVKLFQALVPVPALALLYVAASSLPIGERLSRLALTASVALAVGLSWLAVVTTAPGREQPFAFGSGNGSALSAAFGYDGIDRLDPAMRPAHHAAAAVAQAPGPPGAGRLVGAGGHLGALLGTELVPALILGGVAAIALTVAVAGRWRAAARAREDAPAGDAATLAPPGRLALAGALGVGAWLLTGFGLFSFLHGLQTRYLDALAPAVALALGGGIVALGRWARMPGWAMACAVAAVLAVPAAHALAVVDDASSDSGHLGQLPASTVDRLSAFLQRHTKGERYEVATATAVKAAPLIAKDARPVLMLGTRAGHPLTPLRRLIADVRHREVAYVLVAGRCGPHSALGPGGCGRAARWAKVHGRNLSARVGVPLYAVHAPLRTRRYPRRG
ncbi:glycosyltransferase family 39 protein [Candidatus Solirubrobacter pratensis]|uniref:glycosyltransferase family 39 protein n=1 Tax=Candidatus Solirubrobacter pratensis TaxID=1298857 RepID=UPI00041BC477|nr:glycosyltransferase family 39 protein [Candidatus Solirubrobacter pratensis]